MNNSRFRSARIRRQTFAAAGSMLSFSIFFRFGEFSFQFRKISQCKITR